MEWNIDPNRPVFIQIVERIMDEIFAGKYEPGSQIPSVRELALDAEVNPNTMQKALSELERTGIVYTKRASGRFVTDDTELIATLKRERADGRIKSFLEDMKKMGMSRQEVIEIISKEDNNNE